MQDIWNKYKSRFSVKKFTGDLPGKAKSFSIKAVYKLLLMFHAYKRQETPAWAKHIVVGTLGYVLTPIDMLPDLTPLLGYTDDISVLAYGLVMISCYINEEVQEKALQGTRKIYGEFDESLILETAEEIS
jgi:uncharacterized membrane protein YkvA (DUF1232 family)